MVLIIIINTEVDWVWSDITNTIYLFNIFMT